MWGPSAWIIWMLLRESLSARIRQFQVDPHAPAVVEPSLRGEVLVSLTPTHGVDVGDLHALALLVVAAVLPSSAAVRRQVIDGYATRHPVLRSR